MNTILLRKLEKSLKYLYKLSAHKSDLSKRKNIRLRDIAVSNLKAFIDGNPVSRANG
jgi:hypothetical protein